MLGVPLGQSIRAAIQPGIEKLQQRVAELEGQVGELREAVQDALTTCEYDMQYILDNGRLRDALRSTLAETEPKETA